MATSEYFNISQYLNLQEIPKYLDEHDYFNTLLICYLVNIHTGESPHLLHSVKVLLLLIYLKMYNRYTYDHVDSIIFPPQWFISNTGLINSLVDEFMDLIECYLRGMFFLQWGYIKNEILSTIQVRLSKVTEELSREACINARIYVRREYYMRNNNFVFNGAPHMIDRYSFENYYEKQMISHLIRTYANIQSNSIMFDANNRMIAETESDYGNFNLSGSSEEVKHIVAQEAQKAGWTHQVTRLVFLDQLQYNQAMLYNYTQIQAEISMDTVKLNMHLSQQVKGKEASLYDKAKQLAEEAIRQLEPTAYKDDIERIPEYAENIVREEIAESNKIMANGTENIRNFISVAEHEANQYLQENYPNATPEYKSSYVQHRMQLARNQAIKINQNAYQFIGEQKQIYREIIRFFMNQLTFEKNMLVMYNAISTYINFMESNIVQYISEESSKSTPSVSSMPHPDTREHLRQQGLYIAHQIGIEPVYNDYFARQYAWYKLTWGLDDQEAALLAKEYINGLKKGLNDKQAFGYATMMYQKNDPVFALEQAKIIQGGRTRPHKKTHRKKYSHHKRHNKTQRHKKRGTHKRNHKKRGTHKKRQS